MRGLRQCPVAVLMSLTLAAPAAAQSTYEQLQTFSGLLNQIRLNYVDSVTAEHLVRGAIDGMLASLDPHSTYLARSDAERTAGFRGGRLGGTGIWVDDADDAVVVQSVIRRSPGERAGVLPGDRVLALDGVTTAGLRAPTVQARLFGEQGRRVRLQLARGSALDPETVSVHLRFDRIESRSVGLARALGPGLGYVRLDEFGPNAADEVRAAIGRVVRGGSEPRALILDLRGNPGGLVVEARELAELFLRRGELVFRTTGRRRDMDSTYTTRRDGQRDDLRLVVLIDERSASASEALAGALQDHDRALIMGRRSFGKALMQLPFLVLPREDVVMLTVGWVKLPSGRVIQRRYRGMSVAQYRALAGRAPADSAVADTFRTAGRRLVQGGGGIMPDSILPAPPPLPAWFTAAADSGIFLAVADSVAQSLSADAAARESWFADSSGWTTRLLEPFLARVRARFGIPATPQGPAAARMARILADRVVEVRWGAEAEEDFRLRHDRDVQAAVRLAPTVPVRLAMPPR